MATLNHFGVNADSTLQKKISRAETGNLLTALALGRQIPDHASEADLDIINKVQALHFACDNEKILFITEFILWVEDSSLPLPAGDDSLSMLFHIHKRYVHTHLETQCFAFATMRLYTGHTPISFYKQIRTILDGNLMYTPTKFSSISLLLTLSVLGVNEEYLHLLTSSTLIDHYEDMDIINRHLMLNRTKEIGSNRIRNKNNYQVDKKLTILLPETNGKIRFSNISGCISFHLLIFEIFRNNFESKFPDSLRALLQQLITTFFINSSGQDDQVFFNTLDNLSHKGALDKSVSLNNKIEITLQVLMHLDESLEAYISSVLPSNFEKLIKAVYHHIDDFTSANEYIKSLHIIPMIVQYFILKGDQSIPDELIQHLIEGKNIRSFKNYRNILSKKSAHIFHTLEYVFPHQCIFSRYNFAEPNFLQIVQYCEIRPWFRHNYDAVYEIAKYVVVDLEEPENNARVYRFWGNVCNFLKNDWFDYNIGIEEFSDVDVFFSFLKHCLDHNPSFSLKGRKVFSVNKIARNFWMEKLQKEIEEQCDRPVYICQENPNYKIIQLYSADGLRYEGLRMSHCISSYVQRCQDGYCTIWSLREYDNNEWIPRVTIEVDQNQCIVQMKSRFNADPSYYHSDLIKNWARKEKKNIPGLFM